MTVPATILSGYVLAAGAQSRNAGTASIATGPWQPVGEQVLIGPVTMPATVWNEIALSAQYRHLVSARLLLFTDNACGTEGFCAEQPVCPPWRVA
jgi:hypothetical protein